MAFKFKLDENLPASAARFLRETGHDVATAIEEQLGGAADPRVAAMCRSEERALVTLDRGLGNIRAYPPKEYHGIVVLRVRDQSIDSILARVHQLVTLLDRQSVIGALWILEEDRVRIRQ